MFKRFCHVIGVISLIAGCSAVSEEDAQLYDTYSLCYELASSAPVDRSATLKVVSRELARRGKNMSDQECKLGTKDARNHNAEKKIRSQENDARLEAACIASGGVWYVSFCKQQSKKIDMTVHHL
ncbi:TPA: hypothetical protein I7714_21380 [Vibrio vulnificus]|nr:hypothetical protein [Vibrio vulnificus]